jgi:mono/diheme cytochrome c family protein
MDPEAYRSCENSPVICRLFLIPLAAILVSAVLTPNALATDKIAPSAQSGAALFRDKGCAFCHGADLTGTKKAPSLAGINKDKAWPAARITTQILNGGQKMPPFRDSLDDSEIADLVAYLRAKVRPSAPPPVQAATPSSSSPN